MKEVKSPVAHCSLTAGKPEQQMETRRGENKGRSVIMTISLLDDNRHRRMSLFSIDAIAETMTSPRFSGSGEVH